MERIQVSGWGRGVAPTVLALMGAMGLLAGASAAQPAAGAAGPVVQASGGLLRGATQQGIHSFKGIPYGASTSGTQRFRAPLPAPAWRGTRDALEYGDQCPQMQPTGGSARLGPLERESEDCLVLNVWTPGVDARRRPVMVWLHGGGYVAGSGSSPATDGAALARRGDLVVVTLNHRLNAFGYLYLAHLGVAGLEDSGNAGQLDLVLALQWVRDNIAAFGGDPDQVTVFGQSGGGSKAATLMATPAARGLFHRAILQSGFGLTGIPVEEAKKITDVVLRELELPPSRARELQRVPVERLVAAVRKATGGTPVGIGPVIDGRSLSRHPFTPDAPAQAADIPVMLGANKDEATVLFPPADAFTLGWDGLSRHLQAALPDTDVDELIKRLRALRPAATPSQLYFTVTTELGMGHNSRTFATRKSRQPAAVYLYRMEWETPLDGGRLGAYHGLEVALAFDNVKGGSRFTGGDAEAAQKVADAMSEAWVRFARTGNPNGPGLAWWPAFEPEAQPTMIFEESSRAAGDPVRELRMLLEAPPPRR